MKTVATNTWAEVLQSALTHHQCGRLAEAAVLYQHVLAQNPAQPDALRLSGILAHQRGDLDYARQLLERALQVQPQAPEIHQALGLVWFDLGQCHRAIAAYRAALVLRPNYPEAHYNLGNAHYALREIEAAREAYRQAAAQQPTFAEAHYNLGLLAQETGDEVEAIRCYEQALRGRPDYPEAWLNLGLAQQHVGHLTSAVTSFLKALECRPDYIPALLNLGTIRHQEKSLADAEACFRRVLTLHPGEVPALLNLAMVLDDRGVWADAEQALQSALQSDPASFQAHSYLAGLLKRRGRFEEATTAYRRAIDLAPDFLPTRVALVEVLISSDRLEEASALCEGILSRDSENAEALVFLGMVRFRQRRLKEAWPPYEKALRINSTNPDARLNLALCQLLLGEYRSGFKNYEARWQSKLSTAIVRSFAEPRWEGEDVKGKTVLLYAEQGLGDAIQFVRYAPLVARRGARVIVECPAPLKRLFQGIREISTVVVHGEPLPHFDCQIPFLSLPIVFETTLETVPRDVPYLPRPEANSFQLPGPEGSKLKVGLVWAGNPKHSNDKTRSISPTLFGPLWTLSGVAFYSLQVGPASQQLAQTEGAEWVHDLSPYLTDFTQTAAVVAQLDLIVSVDTSVAHLGGALAKPVWLLLPFVTDWRWLVERDDSPWYPTLRLFRQSEPGNWPAVIENVRRHLIERMSRSPSAKSDPLRTATAQGVPS